MRQRALVAAAAAVVAGLAANCGGHSTLTNTGGMTSPSPTVFGLKITPPDAIAPGQTVQFKATASLSNSTTADYTGKVTWITTDASVLSITRDTGQATGQSVGDAMITASIRVTGSCCSAQIAMTVLPPNTYRLTGKALESGLPVQGAAIVVVSGIGAGLSATTAGDGAYRLYGVAGPIQVKFSKAGYSDIVKAFTATQNDVLDFPEVHQAAAIPSLAGTYTLTLTADPACPTVATRGTPPLPDDFRQPRSYAASVTQDGPSLTVTLTGPEIVPNEDHFNGRVEPDSIEFQVGTYDYYYGLTDLIAERVSATQKFAFSGQLHAQRSGSAINGRLDGSLEIIPLPQGAWLGLCVAPNNTVTLTRAAQPSRHRSLMEGP
jgi:hypothetical protein